MRAEPSAPVPRGNVVCGYLYGDGIMCHEPAGPDHEHPRDDVIVLTDEQVDRLSEQAGIEVGCLAPVVDGMMRAAMEVGFDEAAVTDPAPGLWAALTGQPLPTWKQMRERYPELPPAVYHPHTAAEVGAVDAGEVDFRHMLKDDAAAWSAKSRLEHVLNRPYLATQLADQLEPHTAAALADRLETLVSQAVAETELRISAEMSKVVTAKMAEIRRERSERVQEVTRERFTGRSRLD